jgi:hypothetical protein
MLALGAALVLALGIFGPAAAESPSPGLSLAMDDAYATDEDIVLMVDAPGVLSNDAALPTSCVAAIEVSGLAGSVGLAADGALQYTPQANFHGDTAFTYGLMLVAAAGCPGPFDSQAAVHITVNPINDAPIAVADGLQALAGTTLDVASPGVLRNDTDVDGDSLSALKVSNPVHGVVVLAADGSFSYTPSTGFIGTDAFSYRASDGIANSAARVVTIQVTAIPIPTPSPTAAPTPTPSPTPAPTDPPASAAPSPEASLAEPTAAVTFAVTTAAPVATPSQAPAAGPAAHAGGISLPVLLVLVLLGVLLLFGAVYAIPRWINAQRGLEDPDDSL